MTALPAAMASARVCVRCIKHAESVFRIEGMCCGEEATALRRRLLPITGVEDVGVDVVGQRLRIAYDAALLSTNAIVEAVAGIGMQARLEHEKGQTPPSSSVRGLTVAMSGIALAAGLGLQWTSVPTGIVVVLFAIATVAGGVFPSRRAFAALARRDVDINVLMLVAVAGAGALGEWAEAASVVFLFSIAQWLEARSMDRARQAVRALMDLSPVEARVHRDGVDEMIPADRVALGTVLVVRPGERFPLDGKVVAGRSDVNQAPITGESLPVEKVVGDEVFAGTINGHGALEIAVTRRRPDTTLARIIHLVETAQAQRAPAQQFIDTFARWYTPAVIALAVVVALAPPLVTGDFATWFYRALVLLVVSCPCALVISTPVSIVSALAGAARRGVLIKGGIHLERLAAIRAIAMDKTGTLTRAALKVTSLAPLGASELALLSAAASLEARSEHPIAAAIVAEARARQVPLVDVAGMRALPGRGVEGRLIDGDVVCGSERLFRERGLLTPESEATVHSVAASGASPLLVARDGVVLGVIGVADEERDDAANAIQLLHDQGVRPVVMLTGDQEHVAKAVGRRVGVDEVQASLLPHEKVAALQALRQAHGPVAMVGDGVNDAPALAVADVGIAMGAVGSDAALETADVALMSDDLPKIAYSIRLSRSTVRNIRANIAISLALKAAFLLLAVSGVATLWMAVIADTGASLLVVANALRLRRYS